MTSPPLAPLAAGIDVGGTKIAGGLVDPATGSVCHQVTVPTDLAGGGSDVARRTTVELAGRLAVAARGEGARVVAVGVGVPELVSPDGTITSAHLLPWSRDVLAAELAEELAVVLPGSVLPDSGLPDSGLPAAGLPDSGLPDSGLPDSEGERVAPTVRIESDVRCAALAEARFGAGRAYPLFVYLTIGTGIAFSLVQHGVPYTGARGHALLLLAPGAASPEPGAQPPLLEEIAAGPALVRDYRAAGGTCGDDARDVLAAAAAGDPRAAAVVRDAGTAVGDGIALLVNALDPDAVVVGGGLGMAGGPYLDAALQRARRMTWAPQNRELPIVRAGLGVDAGIVGAALAAIPR